MRHTGRGNGCVRCFGEGFNKVFPCTGLSQLHAHRRTHGPSPCMLIIVKLIKAMQKCKSSIETDVSIEDGNNIKHTVFLE